MASKYCNPSLSDAIYNTRNPTMGHTATKMPICMKDQPCASIPEALPCKVGGPQKALGVVPGASHYSRYSTCEWEKAYQANSSEAEKERATAERFHKNAWCVVQMSDKIAYDNQCLSTKKIGERVFEVAYWKEQMLAEIRAMETEVDNITEVCRVLERTLCETKLPLSIIEECMIQREKRLGIERTHDEVERALSKEAEVIRKIQEKLKEFIKKCSDQIRRDRAVQHRCEIDVKDKHHAQGLDDGAHQLRPGTCKVGFHPGIELVDKTNTNYDTWKQYTKGNIHYSQTEREVSEATRSQIECFLRAAAKEMFLHYNVVNSVFNARIQEITDAKCRLQHQLEYINNEIRDIDRTIQLIRRSIHDKEEYVKLGQTRLDERSRRRNVELCHDPPIGQIQSEIRHIYKIVEELKEQLRQAENTMVRLLKTRALLEQDIAIKENTIQIDGAFCMGMRKKMPMDPKIGPVLVMPHVQA